MSSYIDAIDAKIVNLLRDDGRLTNTDIARQLGLSEATVRKRLARLTREEIIRYHVWAEPLKIGYSHYVTLDIQAAPGQIEALAKKLSDMPETAFVAICFGQWDVRASIFGRSVDHVHEIIMKINRVKGLQRCVATNISRVMKRGGGLLITPSGPSQKEAHGE